MRRPEKPVPSRHERAKKNKRPSAIDITIKLTVIRPKAQACGERERINGFRIAFGQKHT